MKTFISILFLSILSLPASAADCTSPHGVESQTRFDAGILYYCNGTNWIRMDTPPGAGGLGCIVGNIAIPPGGSGTFYSATSHADCASISEVRTCTNGVLSGSFSHTSCSAPPPPVCGGVQLGDYCWYAGNLGQSCDQVCASRGGCESADDLSYSDPNVCIAILDAVNMGLQGSFPAGQHMGSIGCAYRTSTSQRFNSFGYVCGSSDAQQRRICACYD